MATLFPHHMQASYLQYFSGDVVSIPHGDVVSIPHASFLPAIFQWLPTCNISVATLFPHHIQSSYLWHFSGNIVSTPHANFLPAIFEWQQCFHTTCTLPTCDISVAMLFPPHVQASYLQYFSGDISTPHASFLPAIFQWRYFHTTCKLPTCDISVVEHLFSPLAQG